jgi:hypothetical protein
MGKGCYHLGEMSETMIRMYCGDCHRFAQFGRDRLIERFGADYPMPTLLRTLKPCNIGNGMSGPQCQLAYWDNLKPEQRAEAIAKGGIPESWSAR